MVISLIYALLIFLSAFMLFRLYYSTRPTTIKNPPPSPPKLPIIGNLHQIGPLIHRSFFSLSERYGRHLMLLHLGSVPTLVVSSTDAAREIMQTYDLTFASKPAIQLHKTLTYNLKELSVAPYGEYWKRAKKIIVHHLLSNTKVQTFGGVRKEEIDITVRKIEKILLCHEAVNLGDLFLEHSSDVLCRATFGRKYNEGKIGKKFKKVLTDLFKVLSWFYFMDYIPQFAWLDRISGAKGKVETVAKDIDEFLESAVEERLMKISTGKANHELDSTVEPFVDVLLRIQKEGNNGISFDRNVVKALLIDSYAAGSETTSCLLEWVMVELLKHPDVLKKVQAEVREIVNGKKHIIDNDLEQMKYLKAVIMETTRLHPPIPIPFPRLTMQDVKVMGCDIAKGTIVYINVWVIGRDPKVWDRAEQFLPERFLGGSLDFVMHDFKFLPFGAGRRSCPGRVFAIAIVENLLANLLCKFDWTLPEGVKEDDIDMNEAAGLASHRKTPLLALATPFST